MATLSSFIKTAPLSSQTPSLNLTFSKFCSPNSNRLSLLSSDIEEDLGFLDINTSEYDHISRDEFWLLKDDEYDSNLHQYNSALNWIETYPKSVNESFFDIETKSNKCKTPNNFYNRFDYLTKTSKNATITKRKIENLCGKSDFDTPPTVSNNVNAKYGTITKGTVPRSSNISLQQFNENNRTFEILESKLNSIDNPNSDTPSINENRKALNSINTNTITKSNRRIANSMLRNAKNLRTRYDAHQFDNFSSDTASDINANITDEYEEDDEDECVNFSSGALTNNNDLSSRLNRTFDMDSNSDLVIDSDETRSSPTNYRNYPTISRNITRTLLRRESSQGKMTYRNHQNNNRFEPSSKLKQSIYSVSSSNDDLLSSECSVISLKSNLSMTSSITGRSEPNLLNAQRNLNDKNFNNQTRINSHKSRQFESRLMSPPTNVPLSIYQNNLNDNQSRISRIIATKIARPSVQNESTMINRKTNQTKNPPAIARINGNQFSKANSFGNMNNVSRNDGNFQMPRAVSQIKHPSLWKGAPNSSAKLGQQPLSTTRISQFGNHSSIPAKSKSNLGISTFNSRR
ncbi:hypothetical protein SSS_02810 [Sarcoptes scabiei]|nr:hypothetical protein SSS_02810 [Sarcoptes scabiei]